MIHNKPTWKFNDRGKRGGHEGQLGKGRNEDRARNGQNLLLQRCLCTWVQRFTVIQ